MANNLKNISPGFGKYNFIALFSIVKIIFYHRFKKKSLRSSEWKTKFTVSDIFCYPLWNFQAFFCAFQLRCASSSANQMLKVKFSRTREFRSLVKFFSHHCQTWFRRGIFCAINFSIIRISISFSDREKNVISIYGCSGIGAK